MLKGTYDPDPKRRKSHKGHRKGVEPAGLKRYRLMHSGTYDPRPRKNSGNSPKRNLRSKLGNARRRSHGFGGEGYAPGPLGKVERGVGKYGAIIGALLAFFIPDYRGFTDAQKWGNYSKDKAFTDWIVDGAKDEVAGLQADPIEKLKYKFLNKDSHWMMPFWISLGAFILSMTKILPKRINRIIQPISTGALAATTIGALFQYGSDVPVQNGRTIDMHKNANDQYVMTTPQQAAYWS